MKRMLFLFAVLVCFAGKAKAQSEIAHFAADPPTCDPTRGMLYYNTTSQVVKSCTALNTWTAIGGGGITSVSSLPGTCTPGVTAPVQLSVPPYGIFYCSATNVWSSTSDVLKGVTCVNCKADAQAVNDATVSNGSNIATTSGGDVAFTAADTGKACFATSGGGSALSHLTGKLSMAQGSFTQTGAHTGTCTVANANASGAANNYFFWGTDDAAALTTWWTAMNPTGTLCRSGVLPGTPFMTSTNFGSAAAAVCKTPITGTGTEGINVTGFGQLTSLMIMLPSFDFTTCNGGVGSVTCLFAGVGISMYQFGIWGGERADCPAASNNKNIMNINTDTHIVNVEILGWCGDGTQNSFGLRGGGGSAAQQAGIIIDGAGKIALQIDAPGIPIVNSWFGDVVNDVNLNAAWPSSNNTFGDVQASGNMVLVGAAGQFQSTSDTCFEGSTALNVGIKVLAGGLANLVAMKCDVSGNTGGLPVWLNGAATVNATNSIFKGGATSNDALADATTGIFNDGGGNFFVTNKFSMAGPCNFRALNTIGCVGLTAQTNNIGATTISTSATQNGASFGPEVYTAYYYIKLTAAGTSGTIAFNLICNNGTATNTQAGAATLLITAAVGTEASGTLSCHAASATAIQYSTTGIITPGALSYFLDVRLRPT